MKGFGTWTDFMQAYGYKAHDLKDIDEAKILLEGLVRSDEQEKQANKSKSKK